MMNTMSMGHTVHIFGRKGKWPKRFSPTRFTSNFSIKFSLKILGENL